MPVISTYCPICHASTEERASIDRAIKSRRESFQSIADRLKLSRRAIQRHRDHLNETALEKPPPVMLVAPVNNITLNLFVVGSDTEDEIPELVAGDETGEGVRT